VTTGVDALFEQDVIAMCQRLSGEIHALGALRRLTGGANMESWRIDYGPHSWVMRRNPPGLEDTAGEERSGIDVESEALVIRAAISSGVTAPTVIGALCPADRLGSGFVMARIDGETLPHKILGNSDYAAALAGLTKQCATELANIHMTAIDALPPGIAHVPTAEMVATLATRYAVTEAAIPVFDLALRWLSDNLPAQRAGVLLHGDFRMGNLMIDHRGIAGVLDWEQAHIGDPGTGFGLSVHAVVAVWPL
jgi:aminoglycoside phosphotransferase (APT) family kinase protein